MEIPLKFAWASLIYLVIGSTMGVIMLLTSESIKPSHTHVLLIGFVAMMIFGVGYHLLPVFAGTDLYSLRLAEIQFWLQNIGLIGLAFTMPYRYASENYMTGHSLEPLLASFKNRNHPMDYDLKVMEGLY